MTKKPNTLTRLVFVLFILIQCRYYSFAQRLPFFNLKVENGLIQSQATCLAQDRFGNLWIGTLGGISRYDGKKIRNYTVSDGLLSNNIIDIEFLHSGELIISTGKSVQIFNGSSFYEIKIDTKNSATLVSSFCQTSSQKIYCLQKGTICKVDLKSKSIVPIKTKNTFTTLQVVNGKFLAASTTGEIDEIDENSGLPNKIIAQNNESFLVVIKMFEDSKKRFWLLCNKGLYVQEHKTYKPYTLKGRQAILAPLLSASEDNLGHLWFNSIQGAFRLKDSSINYYNQENGLSNNILYDNLRDREGNIWMSSDGEGIFRYSSEPFISFDEHSGLPNKQVTGITGNKNGEVFFASYQSKLSSYQLGGKIKVINNSLIQNDIITALRYQEGKGLWIGTRNTGLYLYNQNGLLKRFDEKGILSAQSSITTICTDNQNKLFVGVGKGLLCIEDNKTTNINIHESTPNCICAIGNDSILASSNEGFYLIKNYTATIWRPNKLLDSIAVQTMTSKGNKIYIGTTEKGVIIYNRQTNEVLHINSKNGLSSDFIYNLLLDKNNNLWAGTGRGICKIILGDKETEFKSVIYGKANGIIGLESNSNASYEDNQQHLWFGTTEGVSCFFPSAKPTKAKVVSIVLESVKLFGGKNIDSNLYQKSTSWYGVPENLNLPYRLNNISFAFQAITLSPADKILYQYFLEGASKNWSEWSEENSINFSALEPGNYTLKVKCKINDDIQSQAVLNYSFKIKTPFHKSIWFVVSIIGLAILTGVYLQYAANKRKLNRLKREDLLRKEEQSRVRERTAEDFHDEVGNKLTRINVLTSVLKSKIDSSNIEAERILQQIQDNSQQLYAGTRDILWSLQPSNDNLFEILNHVGDLARELFSETEITFQLSGNAESFRNYKMPLDKSRNFIMIWKEALNNCMKYASAKKVLMQVLVLNDRSIQIRLIDDGKGFDATTITNGNGLKNMSTRAKRLDAQFEIRSTLNNGTQIILILPETK